MYAALWRALPGYRLATTLQCVVLFVGLVAVLFHWVLPATASRLPFESVTLEPPPAAARTAETPPAGIAPPALAATAIAARDVAPTANAATAIAPTAQPTSPKRKP